ncbi:endonuclease V [Halomicrococcus gelatinilyticus]|uniref:endonuclease V n=1 Tax=Halomicrococcus gelatinilyticus TaxID=1702103 RepID=UPI002E163550
MDVVRPEFGPDASLSREEMEALQRDIADAAVFEDDLDVDPGAVRTGSVEEGQASLPDDSASDAPVVGVDQAFVDDRAVSAAVALRDGEVVERAHAVADTEIPYVPGLLSFREGTAILRAFEALDADPDLALVDGSGRIHFREAGIATHVGVMLDLPTVGVAKNLLCGHLRDPPEGHMAAGERVPVVADDSMTAPDGTVVGYALQSRQYDDPERRHVNPLYVSPGHRVGAATAADLVWQTCAGYKLPEPTRLADADAAELTETVDT